MSHLSGLHRTRTSYWNDWSIDSQSSYRTLNRSLLHWLAWQLEWRAALTLPPSFSLPYLLELLPTIVSHPPKEFCLKDSRGFVFLLLFTPFLSLRLCGTSLASFQLWYKLVICLLSLVSGWAQTSVCLLAFFCRQSSNPKKLPQRERLLNLSFASSFVLGHVSPIMSVIILVASWKGP